MTLIRNRPTDLGREYGENLARFCDQAEPEVRKEFPDHAKRCKSCAFRAGTIPNGCEPTVMDATKCMLEHKPFYCHETKSANPPLCAGWAIMMFKAGEPMEAPWPYSDDVAE